MLFSLLLQTCTLFLLFLVNALSFFTSTLIVCPVTLLTFLTPAFLFLLSCLLASFILLLFPTLTLFLLGPLFPFDLALMLKLFFSGGFSLLPSCVCFSCPFLIRFASFALLFGSGFCANLKYPVFAHLRQALLLDQVIE
jgi:hypothetical protein